MGGERRAVNIQDWRAELHGRLPGLMPAPKFATLPDLSRPSLGRRYDRFSKVWLRQNLMPHQQYIADVSGELVPDPDSGLLVPAYSLVVVTFQRQGGKTHLSMTRVGERCLSVPGFQAWYTAQTGMDARDQFLKFADSYSSGSPPLPLSAVVRVMRGAGREMMKYPNGSRHRPYAPTDEGLHGKQSDNNDIDEGWSFTEERGKILLQGSGPTALTRPSEQTFIWSAGGTANSTWLANLVARGRAGEPGMAYFEFGVPDELPIRGELTDDDYREIASYHPAIGHTITVSALKKLRTKLPDDAEYARAAGNRWTEIIGGTIPDDVWKTLAYEPAVPDDAPVGYGAARAADGSEVAVVAAVEVSDDLVVCEVLDVMPPYAAAKHVNAWTQGGSLAVDAVGPSASLVDGLRKLGRPLVPLTTRDVSAATTNLIDSFPHRAIRFRHHPALEASRKVAGTRPSGDGGKLWARVAAGSSIATIEAATLAVWALSHAPAPESQPLVDFA